MDWCKIVKLINSCEWISEWMDGQMDAVASWRAEGCVSVWPQHSTVFCLPTVLLQLWSHCGGPPLPSLRPQCSVSLSLSACSSVTSSLQQWPSACRKCDISVAQPAEYGQRTNLYCPVTHLELVSFLHKEPLFTAYDYSLLHWKKWPHYLWSSINTVCVL